MTSGPPNMMTFQTAAVTDVVLFHLLAWTSSKITILHFLCTTNTAMNMTEVVIKIFQGSAVTQTMQGGLIVHALVANFC